MASCQVRLPSIITSATVVLIPVCAVAFTTLCNQYMYVTYTQHLKGMVLLLGCMQPICQSAVKGSERLLLAGEEVVTKESFISVCWRLIPYWLNNWEQQWGAECSSMMFELPHFAIELLVVLPCVQVDLTSTWHMIC